MIGGWLPGEGAARGTLGALLVGFHDEATARLRYAGRVGSGFTDAELDRLAGLLEPLRATTRARSTGRQPTAGTRFVEPRLVAGVAFREWTAARTLRAPVFAGLVEGADPDAVTWESVEG